ncbi:VIT domain-containing protein [uncultured Kordia sp.]|uniref:VIT domain-containing protein n=1 Tax=uncultured Kordia sp. TaxID=507699 RepID=UPI002606AACE|nr:VIT domain-containing protein [uncultured Kordia sp.]
MKTLIPFVLLLFFTTNSIAQKSPILKAGKTQVGLSSLDITVEIIGNKATTTFDMLYYNPTNQVLEGELSFPLGMNSEVSRFALDVNGKLREAVVVDKELGRIAFEEVVRRRVDPALLEKGTGNNYKARIYPIPAKGYKRVVLAYEQELIYKKDGYYYDLPLDFKNKLDTFKLAVTVFEQEKIPVVQKGQVSGLKFENWNRNFSTNISKTNYIPNNNILIKVPAAIDTKKLFISDDYFYSHIILNPKKIIRKKADEITLFWDASFSMKERNIQKELKFLETYFSYLENVKVHFKSFSNVVLTDKTFDICNGNWSGLKNEIENTIYDGGTNYNILNSNIKRSDLVLLFSDGIQSLSNATYDSETSLIIVNSLTKSNHTSLTQMVEASNGKYINLSTKTVIEAFSDIKYEQYKFLGFSSNSKQLEVYPNTPKIVENTFSITGRNMQNDDSIILNFGHGSTTEETIILNFKDGQANVAGIPRMWAQKKLAHLQKNVEQHKTEIVNLATTYSLVTDYTSLIVLEQVMDYVRYKIEPPAELLEEYNKILAKIEKNPNYRPTEIVLTEDIEEEIIVSQNLQMLQGSISMSDGYINSQSENLNFTLPVGTETIDIFEDEEEILEEVPFTIIENAPVFPGCESIANKSEQKQCFSKKVQLHFTDNFNTTIVNELNLPSGRQRISTMFTINQEGNVEAILVRSSHERISEEVKRVINLLPQMIPGKQRGQNVEVRYALPIVFNVDAEGNVNSQNSEIQQQPQPSAHETKKIQTYKGSLKVADQIVNTPYVKELLAFKTMEEAYSFYLIQRSKYRKTPAYYADVSNLFRNHFNAIVYSDRILSNIAETDFDNYELLKVFGYQLQANNQYNLALFIFKRVLELRTEDVQSYRDLAIAHENVGECQKAFDLYESILSGKIYKNTNRRNFPGLNSIVSHEINYLVEKYKGDIDTSALDSIKVDPKFETFDVRVVVDWNHNDTDIDLYVIDPKLEECSYQHTKTRIGGRISIDMTQGFGPEEFTLKKAIKGDYFVKINYYGDRYQKVENPTFMKVTMYTYYGTDKQTKEIKIIRLAKSKDKQIIAKLQI